LLDIYLIHSVILLALLFFPVPLFLVALASLITYCFNLNNVDFNSATFRLADSFFPSTASSYAEDNFDSKDEKSAAVV
jgi:hypothetical protein